MFDQEHPEQSAASLTIDASSIDTGTPDRDTHLRSDDFFAVATNPTLMFTSLAGRQDNLAKYRNHQRRFATRQFLITRSAARSHRSQWPHS